MRTGILTNSLPAALKVYSELKTVRGCETFILLCPTQEETAGRVVLKHLARLFLKRGRLKSLRLVFGRKVFLFRKPLDHPAMIEKLKSLKLDVGLHKAGVIYREQTINCFRLGILNPHIGLLPEYRGRSVLEWSLIEGRPAGITVFFIDSGIDTGERVVLREEVDISGCESIAEAKRYLFDQDAAFFRRALELLRRKDFEFGRNDRTLGRRYYVMSRLFRGVAEKLIEARN